MRQNQTRQNQTRQNQTRRAGTRLNARRYVRRSPGMRAAAASFALVGLAPLAGLAQNANQNTHQNADPETVDITEWQVPWEDTRPRDPFAVSGEEVWFVGQVGGYLARLDVEAGEFFKIDLAPDDRPHNLIVGADGVVWYAANTTAAIGRYDPASEAVETIQMPDPAARDPHTLVFDDGEKNIWFTAQRGNFVGRLNLESLKVDLLPVETADALPYGVKVAPDGDVWVVLFGTSKLAHVNAGDLTLTEIDLPREDARPRRLEVGADGRVWYVDYAGGFLGVYDPKTERFEEHALPQGEESYPYGMAMDGRGRLWTVATGPQPNVFLGFDPKKKAFVSTTTIPSGGMTVRHMHYHAPTGAVWFGTDTNFIGRAIVEPQKVASTEE